MGHLLRSGDQREQADGQFIQPWDVSVSHDDRIFGPDFGNNRIQIFSKDGDFITSWEDT